MSTIGEGNIVNTDVSTINSCNSGKKQTMVKVACSMINTSVGH